MNQGEGAEVFEGFSSIGGDFLENNPVFCIEAIAEMSIKGKVCEGSV
jgi:hypothetical protein